MKSLKWRGVVRIGACVSLALIANAANAQTLTRSSSFSYYASTDGALNGLLKSETIEPSDASLCVVTSYTYDARGNKNGSTTANCTNVVAGSRAVFASRSSSADFGNAVKVQTITLHAGTATPSAGPTIVAAGQFAQTLTNALGQSEKRGYDPRFGAVISLEGPNQLTTRWEIDDFGRKVKELRADSTYTLTWHCLLGGQDPSSNTVHVIAGQNVACPLGAEGQPQDVAASLVQSIAYSSAGQKIGPFVRVYSDRMGREIRTVTESFDGAGQASNRAGVLVASDVQYNAQGAKIVQTQPYFLSSGSSTTGGSNDRGMTATEYDALGRPTAISVVDPQGQHTGSFGSFGSIQAARQQMSYAGLKVTQTNDKGQERTEEKNINGQVLLITDASGAQLAHQYDAFGNLVKTKDALQNTISIDYDGRGRKIKLTDPDAGIVRYGYDALGQLVWQQNAEQALVGVDNGTTMAYDKLGRMTQRVEAEYTSTWSYDKNFADGQGASTCNKGVGKLCESNTSHGVNRKLVYDSLGRPLTSTTTLGSTVAGAATTMVGTLSYDANGRVDSQTYPTGVKVGFKYTDRGFLEKLLLQTAATISPLPAAPGLAPAPARSLAAGSTLWQAMQVSAWGRAETQWLGNEVNGRANFQAATGRITALTAGTGASNGVQDQSYTWDSLGNLSGRVDNIGDGISGAVNENFHYDDPLNRLTSYDVHAAHIAGTARTVNLHYNALGMLLHKSDVGNYAYPAQGQDAVRPHALQSVTGQPCQPGQTFQYDKNGNLESSDAGKYRSVKYTSFNLPNENEGLQGPGGFPKYSWYYDENHARIVERQLTASGTRTTIYMHPDNQGGLGFERETAASGAISNRHYLSAGGQAIGVLVTTGSLQATALTTVAAVKLEFWHKDHLGSLVATTDHWGSVTARYAYDPFGKRRQTDGRYDEFGELVVDWSPSFNKGTDRGFTGHEHLDDVGIVHMNGRLFDPNLGVFLQADPFIQAMGEMQNFNRYGYCLNNPMGCTDPSGFFSQAFLKLMDPGGLKSKIAHNKYGYKIGSVAITIASGWCFYAASICNGVGQAAWAGYAGASGTDQERAGWRAGISTGVNQLIGEYVKDSGWNEVAHVAWGCAEAEMNDGSCGGGAAGAFVSHELTSGTNGSVYGNPYVNYWDRVVNTMIQAAVGGLASVAGGGNFADGARSAAYAYLFNCLSHEGTCTKEDVPEIRKAGAACNGNYACLDGLRPFAAEAGLPVPGVDFGQSLKQFFGLGIGGGAAATVAVPMAVAVGEFLQPGVVVIGQSAEVLETLAASGPGIRSFYGTVGMLSYKFGDTIGYAANYVWANVVRIRGDIVFDVSRNYQSTAINMERAVMQLKNLGQ